MLLLLLIIIILHWYLVQLIFVITTLSTSLEYLTWNIILKQRNADLKCIYSYFHTKWSEITYWK